MVLLCATTLYATYPPFRKSVDDQVQRARTRVTDAIGGHLSPIHATGVAADAEEPGHPPLNAADEVLGTHWLAPWSASKNPALSFTFAHRVTLKKLILHSGASDAYVRNGRPSLLRLVFSNGESFVIVPKDTSEAQTFSISHAVLITGMQVQVGAVYPGSAGSDVAITDLELFGLTT
ncbi:hypothetical protein AB0D08_17550 [Kitasatospora sp. NPDC048540]|uniref:NADase-type glycan-binding domain-containing protein n=1 Tax=unclassified Kitasatospora TaxID=2633591 RepID=UPI00053A1361|nr:hypothetical protein [Kitasatospora sp. MBT63]